METAALANVYAGGTGHLVLSAEDPSVSVALQTVAIRSAELAQERDERLAKSIAHFVGKSMGGRPRRRR